MTDTYQKIKSAILGKKQIHAVYGGHFREMCPHILGYSKTDEPMAFFYQFAGNSRKGPLSNGDWRCMEVKGLSQVKITDGPWHTGEIQGTGRNTCVDRIDVET